VDIYFEGIKQQTNSFIVLQQTGSQTMIISTVMGLNKTASSWNNPGGDNIAISPI